RRLVAWTLEIVVTGLLIVTQTRYLKNFFGGPYFLSEADLAAVSDVDQAPRYFVSVHGEKVASTGLQMIKTENGVQEVEATYYALSVGDHLLVCKAEGTATSYSGELKPMETDLAAKLFSSEDAAKARARFFPFYIDAKDSFRLNGYWGLGMLVVFGGM